MNPPTPENKAASELKLEAMLQDLLKAQQALGSSVSSTAQFLRFVLSLANENLEVIRSQLETIRDLSLEIDKWEQAS